MTDETQPASSPTTGVVPPLWAQQLAQAFTWAERHPVKLAAASIALPSLSLSYYLHAEHIPLSILSSDVISGLPSLLVMICGITLALFALALMPLVAMLEEAVAEGDGTLRVLRRPSYSVPNILRWLVTLTLPGAILAVAIVLMARLPGHDRWGMPVAILMAGAVFTLGSFLFGKNNKNRHWIDRIWYSTASNFVQMLLSLAVMKRAIDPFSDSESYLFIFAVLLASVTAMAAVQIILVALIELGSNEGKIIARAFHASLVVISAICIFPASGGWLAGRAISSSASGGMECLRLVVTGDKADFSDLIDWNNRGSQITKELSMRAATSSMYYVRVKGDAEDISTVPTDRVSKFVACAPATKSTDASSAPITPGT